MEMMTRKCRLKDYHPYIDSYIDDCRSGKNIVGKDILLTLDYIENRLNNPDVYIDSEKIDKAVELMERYFEISLFDWELFVTALIHCFYKSTDTVVFDTILLVLGRGNGKNGFISPTTWYLTTHYHGVKGYNIDIVANAQDQAQTSFMDIYEMLEETWQKSKKFFYKTKEKIVNLKTNSYIKYNTSNAKTKDSKRIGCLIFDEVHAYEDYEQIKVFTSSFGKRKHSRAFYISTMGNVREGVLDDMIAISKDILNGIITDLGWLPLIYRIDKEEDALEPKNWHKANPSLKYLPELKKEMDKAFALIKYQPSMEQEFYTKRMNWPKSNREIQVTEWENIEATKRPLIDLTGHTAVVGIDYTKINDLASVNIHFKEGEIRYDISHSWLCLRSADLSRLKIPWKQWADEGKLTLVDDVEIKPDLIAEYVAEAAKKYNIQKLALDNFRYALLAKALEKIGFDDKLYKNIKLIRPSDIMKVSPVIESCFANQSFVWGDNPLLRWATNNTSQIPVGKKQGEDKGNYVYGKIEGKSRKTDPFMALVHSMVLENEFPEVQSNVLDLDVVIY